MGLVPTVRFVERGDAHLAYQVFGEGSANVLMLNGVPSHLESLWQFPLAVRANEKLGSFARVALYDFRGTGMSDPLPAGGYSVEEMAADALAVWEAAGFERVVLWGDTCGGFPAIWLATQCADRVDGLVLDDAFACLRAHEDYPMGWGEDALAEQRAAFRSLWGTGASIELLGARFADDERMREEWARYERMAGTPGSIVAWFDQMLDLDVRHLVRDVGVPTLVFHSVTNAVAPVEHGRYLAEHIPGARYIELEVDSAVEWTEGGIAPDVAEFLTGSRAGGHIERSLQVVLFVDIADSTGKAVTLGDAAWRDLLSEFRRTVQAVLRRYEAQEVNTRGDDFFAVIGSPSIAVEVARVIRSEMEKFGVEVRTGLHLGEIERQGDDYAGVAVHIGARIEALATAGEVLVSQTVRDALVGSDVVCASRGRHHLKGIPGEWEIFALEG